MPKKAKPVHYIGTAMCTGYRLVKLVDVWDDEENAVRDGFIDLNEFRDWFWYSLYVAARGETRFPPNWRQMPHLDEIVKAYHEIKRSRRATEVIVSAAGRRIGKSTIAAFLKSEYYVISWDYPLIESGEAKG